MGSLYFVSWTLTIDNCYDQVSDRVSNQYVGIALARSEQWVTEQWWQGEGEGVIYLCPVSGHSQTYIFISFKLLSFSIVHLSNKSTCFSGRSHQHSQQEQDFPRHFPRMLKRKHLTPLSGRSVDSHFKEITKIIRKLTGPCAPSPGIHKRIF